VSTSQTISPGVYQNISVSGSGSLTLNPGTYVILGQLSASGQGQVSGTGVSLYLACPSYPTPCATGAKGASVSLSGNGPFQLSGPTNTCVPVTLFSDPKNTATLSLSGNGSDAFSGNVYDPAGSAALAGNGGTFVMAGRVITGTASLSGNGNISLSPPAGVMTCSLTLAPASAGPDPLGTGQQLTATVKSATGTAIAGLGVTFTVIGANGGSATAATDATGTAHYSYQGLKLGTDTVTASLSQGATKLTSSPATIAWGKATPQLATTASGPVTVGGTITDTATLTGGFSPTGSISWNVYNVTDTSCNAPLNSSQLTANLTNKSAISPAFTPTAAGTYQFVATYNGDANNQTVSGGCGDPSEQVTVNRAAPAISTTTSGGPITIGSATTDTATLTNGYAPTGQVTWNVYNSTDTACHTPLNGSPLTANLTNGSATSPAFTPAAPGTYQFVASYPGDNNNRPAAGRCGDAGEQITVNKAQPTIATNPTVTIDIGGNATDTATVSGGFSPTGSVSWNIYSSADTTCQTPLTATPLTSPLANGSATSPPFTPTETGSYQFVASYGGDTNNQTAKGSCRDSSEKFTVNKATPKLTTSTIPAVTVGASVTDTATLTGGYAPTGTAAWNVYAIADTTCHTPLNAAPLTASLSNGSATSPSYTPPAAGTYQFVAGYSGDTNNQPIPAGCGGASSQEVIVSQAAPTIATGTSASSPIPTGGSVTDTATLSGGFAPGGTMTWNVYSAADTGCQTPLNPAPLTAPLADGSATSPPFKAAGPGSYHFVAIYPGDTNNMPITGACRDPAERFSVAGIDHFGFTAIATPAAGVAFTVTVTALDGSGAPIITYTGSPRVSSNLGSTTGCGGICIPTLSLDPFTNGQSTLHVTAYQAQTAATITLADGTVATTTPPFTVTPGGADHLHLTPITAAITTGTAETYHAEGFDVYNNDLGDLTAATTFAVTPDGTCTTNNCTAQASGTHTITGTDITAAGTATLSANPTPATAPTSTITLASDAAQPDVVNATQTLTATVKSTTGNPTTGQPVTLQVTGPNAQTATATTDASGKATFPIVGTHPGTDTAIVTTDTPTATSNTVQLTWINSSGPVTTTSLTGTFFAEPTTATSFLAKPGDKPAFSQVFPEIDFNPPAGLVPNNQTGIGPISLPVTDVLTDSNGHATGSLPAAANGKQAGVSDLAGFDATFKGSLLVAQAGDATFNIYANAGFLLGVGGNSSRVSGSYDNPLASGTSVFEGYPLAGASDQPGTEATPHTVTIHFPAPGSYPYELDYFAAGSSHNSLVLRTQTFAPAPGALSVYAGYADTTRPAASAGAFPYPWQGSPTVTDFVGGPATPYDSGALRFDNNSDTPISLDDVSVDIGTVHYELWGSGITVGPHATTILTQTYANSFDTSDAQQTQLFVATHFSQTIDAAAITPKGTTIETNPAVTCTPQAPECWAPTPGQTYSLAFDHHGHLLVYTSELNSLGQVTYNIASMDPISGAVLNPTLSSTPLTPYGQIALDPNSDTLYVVQPPLAQCCPTAPTITQGISRLDLDTGQLTPLNPDKTYDLDSIATTPDGRLFVTATTGDGGYVYELDPSTGHVLNSLFMPNIPGHGGSSANGITYDPTRKTLFVAGNANCATPVSGNGACEIAIGTKANPTLIILTDFPYVGGDGIGLVADGQGHIYYGGNRLDIATQTVTNVIPGYYGQTGDPNSPAPLVGAGSYPVDLPTNSCTASTTIPQIHVTQNGTTTTYADTSQILNTKGADAASCGTDSNESTPWTLIGGTPAPVNQVVPPAVTLTLTPRTTNSTADNPVTATISATDATGHPLANLPVRVQVTGMNPAILTGTTDSNGTANISYTGTLTGFDDLQATAFVQGMEAVSDTTSVSWSPAPPPPATGVPVVASVTPGSGPASGGTVVTLTGSGLSGTTAVSFGQTPALNFTVDSDTQITATVPPAPYSFFKTKTAVIVSNPGGMNQLLPGSFFIWFGTPPRSQGDPTITQVNPGQGPATGGTTVTITGSGFTGFGGTSNVYFGTTPAISYSVINDTTLTAVTPPAPNPAGDTTAGITIVNGLDPNTPNPNGDFTWIGIPIAPPGSPPAASSNITVTALSPAQGPATGDTTVTVTGTGFTGATGVLFGQTSATSFTVNSDTSITAVAPPAPSTSADTTTPIVVVTPTASNEVSPADLYTWLACVTIAGSPPSCVVAPGADNPNNTGATIGDASPPDGTRITAPVHVTATITAPGGDQITAWSVTLQNETGGPPTTVASGTGTPPATLGTLDPTIQQNGTYQLDISATTSNVTQTLSETVLIDGALKLGHYVKTFTDLTVPVGTTSLQVQRVYDSYDKSARDFGVGWHLGISGFSISTNGPLGQGVWDENDVNCGIICQIQFTSAQSHTVTVVWPDGHQETFNFTPYGASSLDALDGTAAYSPVPNTDTTSTLAPADSGDLTFYGDGNLYGSADDTPYNPREFALTAKDGTRYLLSTTQGLISVTDPNGNTTIVGSSGIRSSAGPSIAFTRDSLGRITAITDPAGNSLSYVYTPAGDLASSTNADTETTTYSYNSSHDLLAIDGPNSTPLETLGYDASGRLTTVTDAAGFTVTVTPDVASRTETFTDPTSNMITIDTYDVLGDLLNSEEISGSTTRTTSYTYDAMGRRLTITSPDGRTSSYTYDISGNLSSVTDPTGETTKYSYGIDAKATSITDPTGATTTYAYNSNGQPASITDPTGATTLFVYDAVGNLTSTTDPLGRITVDTYDSEQHLASQTDAEGNLTTYTHDADGRITSFTPAAVAPTTYGYDPAGRLTSFSDAGSPPTTYTYNTLGQLLSTTSSLGNKTNIVTNTVGLETARTDPTGAASTYTYDADGRLLSRTDPLGHTNTNVYDAFGNLASTTDANQHTTRYTYDTMGHLLSRTDASGGINQYTYTSTGMLSSISDPDGSTTTYTYDPDGRPIAVTDALHGKTTLAYDGDGRLTTTTDADGHTTTNSYDPAGQLMSTASPATGTTSYTYDAAGDMATETNGDGVTIGYNYDANRQVTQISGPGVNQSFAYDSAGRRTTMTDPTGTTTYAYDATSQLTDVTSPEGDLKYTYDAVGRQTSMTLSGGETVKYSYNPAGELVGESDPSGNTFAFAYDPAGNETQIVRPNGVTTNFAYTPSNQVASISNQAGSTVEPSFGYTYDPAGYRTSETSAAGTSNYIYDQIGRLSQVDTPAGTEEYSYDPAGNLLTDTTPAGTTTYDYNASGQLISAGPDTYTYDPAGNTTSAGQSTYAYDGLGELTQASTGSNTYNYLYNGDGLRTATTPNGSPAATTLWNMNTSIPTPVKLDGNTLVQDGTMPLEELTSSGTSFPLTDALGSVRAVTSTTGAIDSTQDYSPYGSIAASTGSPDSLRYTGAIGDPTGLDYMQARYYDPATRRFLTADSVYPNGQGTQGYNLYSYVEDNPATATDPTGHLSGTYTYTEQVATEEAKAEAEVAEASQIGTDLTLLARVKLFAASLSQYALAFSAAASAATAVEEGVTETTNECAQDPYRGSNRGSTLRNSLLAGGDQPDTTTADEAHHIVPGGRDAGAPARFVLCSVGIGINDYLNGVFLPTIPKPGDIRAIHTRFHGYYYFGIVNAELVPWVFDYPGAAAALLLLKLELQEGWWGIPLSS
jgi:RHS repeat-associated protein